MMVVNQARKEPEGISSLIIICCSFLTAEELI